MKDDNTNKKLQIALQLVKTPFWLMASKTRKSNIVKDKQIVMYLLSVHGDVTNTKIGEIFCTHHSMVTYAVKTVNAKAKYDKLFREDLAEIVSNFDTQLIIQKIIHSKKNTIINNAKLILEKEGYNVCLP